MNTLLKILSLSMGCLSISACSFEADCDASETIDVVISITEKKMKQSLNVMAYLSEVDLSDIDYSIDIDDIKETSYSESSGKYYCKAMVEIELPDLDRYNRDKITYTVEPRGNDGEFYVQVSGL